MKQAHTANDLWNVFCFCGGRELIANDLAGIRKYTVAAGYIQLQIGIFA